MISSIGGPPVPKNLTGGLGGRSPPVGLGFRWVGFGFWVRDWVLGFGFRRPPGLGFRLGIGCHEGIQVWDWDWVQGLGNITTPGQ